MKGPLSKPTVKLVGHNSYVTRPMSPVTIKPFHHPWHKHPTKFLVKLIQKSSEF